MPSAFPGSLDDLSNPAGGDQVAVVLHSSQHGNVNDIIEAIERKLGIGDSVPGSTPGVLRRTGNGASQWGLIQGSDLDPAQTGSAWAMLLDWKENTDLYLNSSWPANQQMPLGTAKTITVQSSTSLIEIAVRVGIYNGSTPSASGELQSYVLIDGATRHNLGSGGGVVTNNPLAGAAPIFLTGLSAGNHTIQVFAYTNSATSGWYLRCLGQPTLEWVIIQVIEHKAGAGVKGDVGPSAQTAGGTKQQLSDSLTTDVSVSMPTAGTWYTVRGPLSFTVDDAASIIGIDVSSVGFCQTPASWTTSRMLIDGSIARPFAGGYPVTSEICNPMEGGVGYFTGLSPGSHTVALQVMSQSASVNYYCRPLTYVSEFMRIVVSEHKQGGLAWVYKSTWSNTTTYAKNDVVIRNGSAYVALQPHTGQDPVTATAYWGLMASKGDIGIAWKGPWSAATAYVPNDTVSRNGSTWIAKANNTNADPPSSPASWDLLAAAGSMINPMTTADDLIVGGASGTPTRLAKGTSSRIFGVDASGVLGYRQLVDGDVPTNLITSRMLADGAIVNADIATSAGIAWTKMAATGFANTVLGTADGTNCAAYYIDNLIRAGSLTAAMIATNAIQRSHIAPNQIAHSVFAGPIGGSGGAGGFYLGSGNTNLFTEGGPIFVWFASQIRSDTPGAIMTAYMAWTGGGNVQMGGSAQGPTANYGTSIGGVAYMGAPAQNTYGFRVFITSNAGNMVVDNSGFFLVMEIK